MKRYPWEIGSQLVNEIQAKDNVAAQNTFTSYWKHLSTDRDPKGFERNKLRVMQMLTLASRAAYTAGANTERLFKLNIQIVSSAVNVQNNKQLLSKARSSIKRIISLIPENGQTGAAKVDQAIDYIRKHGGEHLSRRMVAKAVGCSPSHLSRLFAQITGHTFKEVILIRRMEIAKAMLSDSDRRIIDVALDLGYGDPNYFSSSFKRITGVTPRQYRKITTAPQRTRKS